MSKVRHGRFGRTQINNALPLEINFVSTYCNHHIGSNLFTELLDPLFNFRKRILICDVINQDGT